MAFMWGGCACSLVHGFGDGSVGHKCNMLGVEERLKQKGVMDGGNIHCPPPKPCFANEVMYKLPLSCMHETALSSSFYISLEGVFLVQSTYAHTWCCSYYI
mmetsp:Transcript_45595/g.95719  ORF Transcript_45595/g.95719 Transcript_45595/m.95719 type:complete len:101 (+) Transcript_45595:1557-1859(+)